MAIERNAGMYTPVCDNCYKELCEQFTFEDAVEHLRSCGWATVKDEHGEWCNYCPECEHELLKKHYSSAASDFEGVGL